MTCHRKVNCRKIRTALAKYGRLTRREIADVTRLECGEVSARVKELLDSGKLQERGHKLSPITGRPVGLIRLAKRSAA